jgi:Tfp pilus assembly PilM family ATPase
VISAGLELCGNTIKLAVVEGGTRGKMKVKASETCKIDAKKGEVEDDIVSVLEDALKRTKAPVGNLVCSVRAQDCMIREIVVPFTDEDKIRKTVKYQAENYFTSLSIDDLIIEFSKVSEHEGKSKLLVAGIKKSHIDRRLRFLDEAGADPLAIDLDVAALFNTYAHMDVFADKGAVLLVEIESDTLKVGLVEEGRLRLARAIRMRVGSMRLQQTGGRPKPSGADSGTYDTAADESARLPVVILDEADDEAFSLEDSGISEVEREGILHRVFMEIDRTVAAVQLVHEIDLICLTGASCRLEGIEDVFSEHFEVDAVRVDLKTHFETSKNTTDAIVSLQGATAIGLALKGLGIDHAGMDFRKEEFVYQGTFAQIKRGLATVLTLMFAMVFLYAFNLKQELKEKNNTLRGVKAMQKNLYTVLFPSIQDTNVDHLELGRSDFNYYESLKRRARDLSTKYGGGGTSNKGPSISALEVLRGFAAAKATIPRRRGMEVMKINIDPRPATQSRFVCFLKEQEGSVELAREFQKNEQFVGTARDLRRDRKTDKWMFEFIVKVKDDGRR